MTAVDLVNDVEQFPVPSIEHQTGDTDSHGRIPTYRGPALSAPIRLKSAARLRLQQQEAGCGKARVGEYMPFLTKSKQFSGDENGGMKTGVKRPGCQRPRTFGAPAGAAVAGPA